MYGAMLAPGVTMVCTGPVQYARGVDPKVAWAKLAALVEGARLATNRLWN